MTICVNSFDFDDCLCNEKYYLSVDKNIVAINKPFLDDLKKISNDFSKNITFLFSLRQSKDLDDYASAEYGTCSCFSAIREVSTYLEATYDPLLLADIFGDLPEGTSFGRILDQDDPGSHHCCVHDITKLTILFSQMHHVAKAYPHEDIVFNVYDDKEILLERLFVFFKKYPEMMPRNIILHLNNYKGYGVTSLEEIHGTGVVDYDYRQTVINMVEVATNEITSLRECVLVVTPELLANHKDLSNIDASGTLYTKKSVSLHTEIELSLKRIAGQTKETIVNVVDHSSINSMFRLFDNTSTNKECSKAGDSDAYSATYS